MPINTVDELHAATKKGKIASAKEVFLTGDIENLQQIGEKTHQLEDSIKNIAATGGASTAAAVTFDNAASGMTAVNAQGAIEELSNKNKSQDTEISKKANVADVTSQMQAEQIRVNTELDRKIAKTDILQELGDSKDKVVSQKCVKNAIDDINIKKTDKSETEELGYKLIKIVGTDSSAVNNVGDVFYSTSAGSVSYRKLRKAISQNDDGSYNFVDVPFIDGAIYTFNNSLYIYNGVELEKRGVSDVELSKLSTSVQYDNEKGSISLTIGGTSEKESSANNNKLLYLKGIAENSILAGATSVGDVFFNTQTKLLRERVNSTDFNTIPFYKGAIYTCDGILYIWDFEKEKLVEISTSLKEYVDNNTEAIKDLVGDSVIANRVYKSVELFTDIPIEQIDTSYKISNVKIDSTAHLSFKDKNNEFIELIDADGNKLQRIYGSQINTVSYPITLSAPAVYVRLGGDTEIKDISFTLEKISLGRIDKIEKEIFDEREVIVLSVVTAYNDVINEVLKNEKYGMCTMDSKSTQFGLFYKDKEGTISLVENKIKELKKKRYIYCGVEMGFNEDGNFIDISKYHNVTLFPDLHPLSSIKDYSEETWNTEINSGVSTVLEQVYSYMDALVKKYPTFVTKYEPTLKGKRVDEGVVVDVWEELNTYLNNKGFSDYPIYCKGIESGKYNIGEYKEISILETPMYHTYLYKISIPQLKNVMTSGALQKKKCVYIQGGAHAPEYGGSIAVCHLAEKLLDGSKESLAMLSYFDFYLNPVIDGYATIHALYHNALGVNINRNYPTIAWANRGDDYGLAAGDQFETCIVTGIIDLIKPVIAIDTHCLTSNLTLGVSRTPFYRTFLAFMDNWNITYPALYAKYPQYFGKKSQVPTYEISNDTAGDSTARSYFFNKGIECSGLVEVISRVNFIADENGNMTTKVRDETLYNKDTINISAYMLLNNTIKLCQTWISRFLI